MNNQPVTKQDLSLNGISRPLQVTEIFDTIQGEGPWSGLPCTFIRLAGCNLCCTWCDTEYSSFNEMSIKEIGYEVNHKHVVITGGEPFRQNITPLVKHIINNGYSIQIETNGTLTNPSFPFDKTVVVCSPKTHSLNKKLLPHIKWFKYVVGEEDKISIHGFPTGATQAHSKQAPYVTWSTDRVILMPRDDHFPGQNQRNRDVAVSLVRKFGFRLNLQLHKILNLP